MSSLGHGESPSSFQVRMEQRLELRKICITFDRMFTWAGCANTAGLEPAAAGAVLLVAAAKS